MLWVYKNRRRPPVASASEHTFHLGSNNIITSESRPPRPKIRIETIVSWYRLPAMFKNLPALICNMSKLNVSAVEWIHSIFT